MKLTARRYLINFWNDAEYILISLFFLTFTFNIRKIFLTPFSYINSSFNEYGSFSFSWADLLMLSTIIFYAIKSILCQCQLESTSKKGINFYNILKENNKRLLSIFVRPWNIPYETLFLTLFLIWSLVSVVWSTDKPISIYRSLTLFEILAFFYIIYLAIKAKPVFFHYCLYFIIFNGTLQSILGIIQFFLGHSTGLSIIGESFVSHETPGVAKIIINGAKHIRAYGTFAHPNILAGFLLIPIFIIFGKLFNKLRFSKNSKKIPTASADPQTSKNKLVFSHETTLFNDSKYLLSFLLVINLVGLGLTFSRSAILGLFLGLAIFMFHVKYIKSIKWFIILITLIAFILSFSSINFVNKHSSLLSSQSLEERVLYNNVSHETINYRPVQGVGIGQFVINEYMLLPNLDGWRYQPEHNSYLLIFSELGAVGFILFSLILVSLISCIGGKAILTHLPYYCLIISFYFILFFDHYFWDIKTGIIIFALGITLPKLISSSSLLSIKSDKISQ
jgi:O-antigen ligase